MSAFVCTYDGTNLCLQNSTCAPNGHECLCPPNFQHDFFAFHSKNCAVISKFPWAFAIVFTVPWLVLGIILAMRMRYLKNRVVTRFAFTTLVFHVVLEGIVISLAVQEGMFEAGFFLRLLGWFLESFLFQQILIFTIKANYGPYDSSKMKRIFRILLACEGIILFGLFVAGEVFMRNFSPVYDVIYSVGILLHFGLFFVFAIVTWRFTTQLLSKIESAQLKNENYSELCERIKVTRRDWVFHFCISTVLAQTLPITRLIIGSFPYCYVFVYIDFVSSLFITKGAADLIPKVKCKNGIPNLFG